MATVHTLVAPELLGKLLSDLFGKKATTRKAGRTLVGANAFGALGLMSHDGGDPCAAIYFDVAAGCAAGAALALIPPNMAAEGERQKKIPDNIFENLAEVMNIARGWFQDGPPLILDSVEHLPATLTKPVLLLLLKPAERIDVELEVPGYSTGKLSIFLK